MMYNNCVVEIIVNNQSKQHLYFFLENLEQRLALYASQSMHLTCNIIEFLINKVLDVKQLVPYLSKIMSIV